MTCYGSYIRFNMSVGMRGYPFKDKHKWMNKNDFKNFITDKEDKSDFFNELITDMFYHSQKQKPIK